MKIFILEEVDQVSNRWHSDGGLVIIAKDLEQAKELASLEPECVPTKKEWSKALVYNLVEETEPRAFVFPDAGCC